jgi:hypothetical protein
VGLYTVGRDEHVWMHGADYLLCAIREGRVGSNTTVMGSTQKNLQEESQSIWGTGESFLLTGRL